VQSTSTRASKITAEDVDLVSRYFSIKTLLDVDLRCDDEAKQVLGASLTDPSVRHALSSLKALRQDLEISGNGTTTCIVQRQRQSMSMRYSYGLEQYDKALGGLTSGLSFSFSTPPEESRTLKSALLCCQVFIGIEQILGDYAAMAQHIVRGLGIMHEYRTGSGTGTGTDVVTDTNGGAGRTRPNDVPLLDVFIVKLFAAPCKFADLPPPPPPVCNAEGSGTPTTTTAPSCTGTSAPLMTRPPRNHPQEQQQQQQHVRIGGKFREIAPDMRTELTRIATSTLEFLDPPSSHAVGKLTKSPDQVRLLLHSEKAALLDALSSWLDKLDQVMIHEHNDNASSSPSTLGACAPSAGPRSRPGSEEPISVSFLRLFYQIVKIVLLGSLDSSPDTHAKLRVENDRLQALANRLGERVRSYKMS
jgi:hypothetical protein